MCARIRVLRATLSTVRRLSASCVATTREYQRVVNASTLLRDPAVSPSVPDASRLCERVIKALTFGVQAQCRGFSCITLVGDAVTSCSRVALTWPCLPVVHWIFCIRFCIRLPNCCQCMRREPVAPAAMPNNPTAAVLPACNRRHLLSQLAQPLHTAASNIS
jgi:hypothetical protein